jgi:gamma-glutamyltranspeptidase/glutathione hydrolase
VKKKSFLFIVIMIYLVFLPWGCAKKPAEGPDLSPGGWPGGELEKYAKLNRETGLAKPVTVAGTGMVVGGSSPLAIRAGVEALKKGGSAADAALTTSLAQVCLLAGSNVSYAGILTMLYYDANTGKIHSMHGGWNSVKEETDPGSIPNGGTPSGRQVLVPGFMAGVGAAHQRFGKLPFASLFGPAIYFAEKGFIVDKALAVRLKLREQVIVRFPVTKKILLKENGELYKEGDLLKQPGVAGTLRKVAQQGADYMYRGDWAKKFVRAVRKQGGKMTLKDLQDYKVIWSEPAHTRYREYDLYSMGPPGMEGVSLIWGFNLLELADLKKYGHYSRSAQALYQYIQVSRFTGLFLDFDLESGILHETFSKYFGRDDFSRRFLSGKQTAALVWKKMREPSWNDFKREIDLTLKKHLSPYEEDFKEFFKDTEKQRHTDCVVAVDKEGNIAAVVHSINSRYYGLGLTVDGVTLSDTGSFVQGVIARVGPGNRLPLGGNQVIALKKEKPFLATSCMGAIHEATSQCVLNVLDYNMEPQKAAEMPLFLTPALLPSEMHKHTVGEGAFAEEILEAVRALGQEIKVLPKEKQKHLAGGWVGIKIHPKTGKLTGGVSLILNGVAAGY